MVDGVEDAGASAGTLPAAHWCVLLLQCSLAGHVPQLSAVPQLPSGTKPQMAPCAAHVDGVHVTHWSLELQASPEPHEPHERKPPQPSEGCPQCAPSVAHVAGVQHWFPLQTWPLEQYPQNSVLPHPSEG
jgi:hypothetical protein